MVYYKTRSSFNNNYAPTRVALRGHLGSFACRKDTRNFSTAFQTAIVSETYARKLLYNILKSNMSHNTFSWNLYQNLLNGVQKFVTFILILVYYLPIFIYGSEIRFCSIRFILKFLRLFFHLVTNQC